MNVSTKWFEDKGDETVALHWPINSESQVWEIGGFEGRWAGQMSDKFHCQIDIFEPQLWAFERMLEKFKENKKIALHPYGLWVVNTTLKIYNFETDGASVVDAEANIGKPTGEGNFVDIWELCNRKMVACDVEVCLMNIEGAEFTLLPYMIGMGLMKHFQFFWCQFHPGLVAGGDERYNQIFRGLSRSHDKLWDYYPTAVAWERK